MAATASSVEERVAASSPRTSSAPSYAGNRPASAI